MRIQDENDCVLLVSAAGFAKRLPVGGIHLGARGGIGTQAFLFKQKTDNLVAVVPCPPQRTITVVTTESRSAQIPVGDVPRQGRDTLTGYRLNKLAKGERIATVTLTTLVDNESSGSSAEDDSEE